MMKKTVLAMVAICLALLCGCRTKNAPSPTATPTVTLPTAQAKETVTPENYALVQPESSETPAPTLGNGEGMPETQSFMNYTSTAGGYDVQVPENWTPKAEGANITFTHGYSGIEVVIVKTAEPFTLENIKGVQVADLVRTGSAVNVISVSLANTKNGPAAYVEYESNSNGSAGKKIRLMNHRYYYPHEGELAVLTMWAPLGADNQNIWSQIPDTFFWR